MATGATSISPLNINDLDLGEILAKDAIKNPFRLDAQSFNAEDIEPPGIRVPDTEVSAEIVRSLYDMCGFRSGANADRVYGAKSALWNLIIKSKRQINSKPWKFLITAAKLAREDRIPMRAVQKIEHMPFLNDEGIRESFVQYDRISEMTKLPEFFAVQPRPMSRILKWLSQDSEAIYLKLAYLLTQDGLNETLDLYGDDQVRKHWRRLGEMVFWAYRGYPIRDIKAVDWIERRVVWEKPLPPGLRKKLPHTNPMMLILPQT